MSYNGNLIIDCPAHFGQKNYGGDPAFYVGPNVKFGSDGYVIAGSDCNEPYGQDRPAMPNAEPLSWIIACEVLCDSTDHYDFNDAVFSVQHAIGSNIVTITPLAAGTCFSCVLCYDNKPVVMENELKSEIHHMLGYTDVDISGEQPKINVTRGADLNPGAPVEVKIDNAYAPIDELATKQSIRVVQKGGSAKLGDYSLSIVVCRPTPGDAPQLMIVPGGWIWPKDGVGILDAYPDFVQLYKDMTVTDWAQNAVNSNLERDYVMM